MTAAVQSLQRAFKILYFVAGRDGGCSVAAIAAGVGLKQVTVYKLIRTLEAEKALVRIEPPVRFTLGPALHELKYLDDGRVWLTESGKALLAAQRELPDASFVLLQFVEGDTYQRLAVKTERFGHVAHLRQHQLHPYEKASSLLFLAYASSDEAALFYARHPFEHQGIHYWQTQAKLDQFLATVRRRGYSHPQFSNEIYHRLAAPVWSPGGALLASIGGFIEVAGTSQWKKKKLITLCRQTADLVTSNLDNLLNRLPI